MMKIANEICRDKSQLYLDRKWQGYNTSQLQQVFLCCDKVFNMGPAKGRISFETTFRVHNKGQQDSIATKIFSVATNKT